MMSTIRAAEADIRAIVPAIVARHRDAGILTWWLMREIETEVFAEISETGKHSPQILNMIRASPAMGYRYDDRPVELEGHSIVPTAFGAIYKAWRRVN